MVNSLVLLSKRKISKKKKKKSKFRKKNNNNPKKIHATPVDNQRRRGVAIAGFSDRVVEKLDRFVPRFHEIKSYQNLLEDRTTFAPIIKSLGLWSLNAKFFLYRGFISFSSSSLVIARAKGVGVDSFSQWRLY